MAVGDERQANALSSSFSSSSFLSSSSKWVPSFHDLGREMKLVDWERHGSWFMVGGIGMA
jgi:hypothetical protein